MHVIPQNRFPKDVAQLILGYLPAHQFSGRSGVLTSDDLTLVHSIINQVSPQKLCEYAFGQMQMGSVDDDSCASLLKFCCVRLEIDETLYPREIKSRMDKVRTFASVLNNFKPHNVIQLKNIFQTFSHLSRYHACLAQNYHSFLERSSPQDLAAALQQNELYEKLLSINEQLRNKYAVVGSFFMEDLKQKYEVRAYIERDLSSGHSLFFIVPENSNLGAYGGVYGRSAPQFSAHITKDQNQTMLAITPWYHNQGQFALDTKLIQVMVEVFKQSTMKTIWVKGFYPNINQAKPDNVDYYETPEFQRWNAIIMNEPILTQTGGVIPDDMDAQK